MEVSNGSRRRRGANGVVAAGSVWESRMKLDEFKVFKSEEDSEENNSPLIEEENTNISSANSPMDKKVVNLKPKQSVSAVSSKRKTWKTESPVQIAKQRSEVSKNLDEQFKELSVSADGIKKTPVQIKKTRSDVVGIYGVDSKSSAQTPKAKSLSLGSGATEKSPIQLSKGVRLRPNKSMVDDGNEKNSDPGNAKMGSSKAVDEPFAANLKKVQLEKSKEMITVDGSDRNLGMPDEAIDKNPIGTKTPECEENCKEFGVCEDKAITSSLSNVGQSKSALHSEIVDDKTDRIGHDDEEGEEEGWDEVDDKEVKVDVEIEKKSLIVKEISTAEQKPKKIVIEEKKHQQSNERPTPISPIVKKLPPPVVDNVRVHHTPTKSKTTSVSEEVHRVPRQHRKLQRLVDIVIWKDIPRSAFIFGVGTFLIISSSYTQDLNISIISVLSYLGLVYLAAIFLFRSLVSRGATVVGNTGQDHVIGEEEAIWLMKLILPYVNEFFLSLRALFSGDPATTMKMAVLLFILARCGSSITIWKMTKLGFFGVFILPKVCSSYSTQITAYGTFWILRFRDAWESCCHKKAVAFGVFTLVWNLSSIVARIWAVFMLFVAFKYYQQYIMGEEAKVGRFLGRTIGKTKERA